MTRQVGLQAIIQRNKQCITDFFVTQLISVLLTHQRIVEGVDIDAEHLARGTMARGSIDYVLLYQRFGIVVVEVRTLWLCGLWVPSFQA